MGDHAWGTESERGESILKERGWQDDPLVFVDHVNKLIDQEVTVFQARAVRASEEGGVLLRFGPRRGIENNGGSLVFVESEEAPCVVSGVKGAEVAVRSSLTDELVPSQLFKQFHIAYDQLTKLA